MDDPVDQVHVLWGALVGGPDIDDYHRDITKDYIYNEVAVDYNAAFVGACAGLYYYYGTEDMKPVENFPPPEEPVEAFTIEALVNQENLERTQYTVKVTSAATQPPAYLDGFTARYYFNISELLAKGQSIDDITIEIYYDQVESDTKGAAHVTVSEPIKVDEENYYVEMDWGDFKFYGTRELQLGIIAAQDSEYNSNWDPTNDYSREGLEKSDTYSDTLNIPLYRNGKLVYGIPYGEPETPPSGDDNDDKDGIVYGDINDDKIVDLTDLTALSLYIIGDKKLEGNSLKAADVTGDDTVDIADLAFFKQYISKDDVVLGKGA